MKLPSHTPHPVDRSIVEAKIACNDIVKKATEGREQTSRVVSTVDNKLKNPVTAWLPGLDSLHRRVRGIREGEHAALPSNPSLHSEFEIPIEYTKTLKDKLFLKYDSLNAKNRILIFTTKSNLRELSNSDVWGEMVHLVRSHMPLHNFIQFMGILLDS